MALVLSRHFSLNVEFIIELSKNTLHRSRRGEAALGVFAEGRQLAVIVYRMVSRAIYQLLGSTRGKGPRVAPPSSKQCPDECLPQRLLRLGEGPRDDDIARTAIGPNQVDGLTGHALFD